MRKLSWMLLALIAVPLQAQEAARDVEHWALSGPRVAVRFNAGLLQDMGVRMTPAGSDQRDDVKYLSGRYELPQRELRV